MTAATLADLHVVSVLTTHEAGGAEYAAVDLLEALADRGARVRLLTNRPELVTGTPVSAIRVDLGPKLRRRTVGRVVACAPITRWRLVRALRREAATTPLDLLLLHYKKEQLLAALVPRSVTGAVVWAEWGPLPPRLRSGAPRVAYALAARSAVVVLAESQETARSVTAAGVPAAKVVVVPNVLDPRRLRFDAGAREDYRRRWGAQEAFVVGCISRLHAFKRVDVAIDALRDLDERVVLVIAGEGEYERELRRRAAPYGSRVRFIGASRGQVAEILSACDVQIYTPGPSEGAARVVTFGQLVERPVIATAAEGVRGLVTEGAGAIVSPENDPTALACCIEAYRSDPARIASEGAASRARALARIEDADPMGMLERALRRAGQQP